MLNRRETLKSGVLAALGVMVPWKLAQSEEVTEPVVETVVEVINESDADRLRRLAKTGRVTGERFFLEESVSVSHCVIERCEFYIPFGCQLSLALHVSLISCRIRFEDPYILMDGQLNFQPYDRLVFADGEGVTF